MTINYSMLPEHMQEGAKRYVEKRIAPGGFLTAVLENNLVEACGRADLMNRNALHAWAQWLYMECPRGAWGSPEAVKAWLKEAP